MNKKLIALSLSAVILGSLITGCGPKKETTGTNQPGPAPVQQTAEKKPIRIALGVKAPHPLVSACELFEKDFEAATNGKYDVQVFDGAKLGDDKKAVDGLKLGTVDITIPSTSPFVSMVKELGVFDLPFLFPNYKAADAVLDGPIGAKIAKGFESQGIVPINYMENGYRQLTNSKKEVKAPADVKGLKVRTMSNDIHMAAWKAYGAETVALDFSKVYGEIKTGNIDGQENPVATILGNKLYEVAPHITLTGHVYTPFITLVSEKTWKAMSADEQKAFKTAMDKARDLDRQLNREADQKGISDLKAAGAKVVELTSDQKKAFQDAAQSVYDQFSANIGKSLIDEVKAEVEKNK